MIPHQLLKEEIVFKGSFNLITHRHTHTDSLKTPLYPQVLAAPSVEVYT